nr:syndecan [Hymenolepis microstoma]
MIYAESSSRLQVFSLSIFILIGFTFGINRPNGELNELEQIGCAKVRRLLALRVLNDFSPFLPNNQPVDGQGSSQSSTTPPRVTFSADNLPACRTDRPDLFKARQCNALDCFCVNVTTGEFLPGTRTISEELADCSTAVLRILLVIHQTSTPVYTDIYHNRNYPISLSSSSPYKINDSYWESRITKALQDICQASMGYQRVASIRRLPSSNPIHQRIRTMPFEVILYSTGHLRTLSSLEELIKHRLDEGYLPGLGSLDPEASCVKLLEESMSDPEPDFSRDLDIDSGNTEEKASSEGENDDDIEGRESSRDPPQQDYPGSNRRRPISVRQTAHDLAVQNSWRHREILNQPGVIADPEPDFSRDLDIDSGNTEEKASSEGENDDDIEGRESSRDPPQQDYPGSNRRRPISVRQTAHDLAVQNSWRHREILNQPGVIAAIVGSTIAGLLLLILLILFCVYRLRKKDEGSYSLEEPQKGATTSGAYVRAPSREFYA